MDPCFVKPARSSASTIPTRTNLLPRVSQERGSVYQEKAEEEKKIDPRTFRNAPCTGAAAADMKKERVVCT